MFAMKDKQRQLFADNMLNSEALEYQLYKSYQLELQHIKSILHPSKEVCDRRQYIENILAVLSDYSIV